MCLDIVYDKPKRKWGVGIKFYKKVDDGYKSEFWESRPYYGDIYKIKESYSDKEHYMINSRTPYRTGYHVMIDKEKTQIPFNFVAVKVRFSQVVAQGIQEYYGEVVVARKITLLEEIKC